MGDEVVVERRFNGPPSSGNGGVLVGLLAERIEGAAEVTLRRPIPLDTPLEVVTEGDAMHVHDPKGELVAEARAGCIDDATLPFPGHPLPQLGPTIESTIQPGFRTCFTCGMDRRPGDGLRITSAPLPSGDVATAWRVPEGLPERDGRIAESMVCAALDCPGLFPFIASERGVNALLGRMTVRIDLRPRAGDECVIVGWGLGGERRKRFSGTALYDAAGRLLAETRATWITVG